MIRPLRARFLCIASCLLGTHAISTEPISNSLESGESSGPQVQANNDFAMKLLQAISTNDVTPTNVLIPRFRLQTSYELKSPLCQLGMPIPFSDEADFGAMSSSGEAGIKIASVVHQAFVEVNEGGTEAAAATAATFQLHSGRFHGSFTPTFVADHPFLFLIRDSETGHILFVGKVEHPSVE